MPQAWDVSKSTGNQIVAVLDTGVDAGHSDLVGRLVPGYNATSPNRGPIDDNGHGTMTLGIIAAPRTTASASPASAGRRRSMPVKVLAADGTGYDVDIAEGISWAADNGAKVINMSLGGPDDNPVLHDAVKYADSKGVIVVAAAGNDGNDVVQFPASYPEVIAVGATNAGGALTSFSSYGDWVDIAAPGWDILSTGVRSMTPAGDEPYWYCTGTSCSAPIVAGVAALVKNKWPTFTPAQVAQRLKVAVPRRRPARHRPVLRRRHPRRVRRPRRQVDHRLPGNAAGRQRPALACDQGRSGRGRSVPAVISTEGESDWYVVDWGTPMGFQAWATGPVYDDRQYAVNFGPVIECTTRT